MHTQRTFAPEGESVPQARRFVRATLEEWDAEDLTDEAVLAASELVTNAVIHAGTPVRVALEVDAQGLRLEVQDLHPGRTLPLGVERPDDDAEHGRGLLIAAAMAGAWGVDYSSGAKRVWLRLERGTEPTAPRRPATARRATEPTSLGVGVVELSSDGEVRSWNHDAAQMLGWTAEEAHGRLWRDLAEPLERGDGAGTRSAVPSWPARRWQGMCTVRRKSGAPAQMFVSRVSRPPGEGWVMLLVPASKRVLLEWPAPQARSSPVSQDPLGLREDALNRLGFEAYLDLVVERSRDRLGAQAAYLLLARDLDGDFEVTTVSGLDASLVGTRLQPGAAGVPSFHNPHLPVVLHNIADPDAETADPDAETADSDAGTPDIAFADGGPEVSWLRGAGLRSLVTVPVVMEGRVIGALGVASDRVAGFSDEEAVLLQRIGNVAAAAADRARLRVSERERRGWLTFLAETGDLLAGSLDQEMTMALTGQVVVPRLATWCAVYLDDVRGVEVLQQVWHRDERAAAALRSALERTSPEHIGEVRAEALRGEVRVIPLVARGNRIGALVLGRPAGSPLHGEALVVAESVARRAALAIDNARVHGELQGMGYALQRSLLPASIPDAPTFEVGVVYEAAGEASVAGGDFYDLFPVGSGRWCFAVGDVCGSGAEAAAVTGLARHTIRALALAGFPTASTLERLNTAIVDEGERSRFLTLVCGTLDPEPGGRLRMSMVSAGHPLPFVVRRTGEVSQVGRPQPLLGVMEDVAFVAEEHVLDRGDLLVAVTDGVLERRDGSRMLEEQGLMADLALVGDLPAQAVAERIRRLVGDFGTAPQADDMAVLAIRVGPKR